MNRGKLYFVLLALIVIPFAARYQVFFGMRQQIPLAHFAHIQHGEEAGPGQPTLESNMGFTAQALGTRAAIDWFRGRVPLWNYFEGTGVPLAGEMQSAALFLPFILLLRSLSGQIFFHISLQIVAGICTFFYLRKIRLGVVASFCGAVFFELNGTFAWMANAAYNPIAFLPMALLGLELAIEAAQRGAKGGWLVLCAGAVWSVYAGFPEVAFVDALLVAVYFLFRASQISRAVLRPLVIKLGLCLLVTLFLIAPLVGQFADFLSFSFSEGRSNAGGPSVDPRVGVVQLLVPYIYGPLLALDASSWRDAAGYLGFAMTVLAMAGVGWQWRNRLVQCFAVWAVICILKIYGEPLTSYLMLKVPALRLIVLVRWLVPSLEFSFVVLSATAIEELYSRRRTSLWAPAFIAIAIVFTALWFAQARGAYAAGGHFFFRYAAMNILFVVFFALACCCAPQMGRHAAWMISSLGILEAFVLFNAPIISAPRNCVFDMEGLAFLRHNLGLQRFYTLGPVLPNYGSAFDAAELNYDDMPVNKYLVQYFKANLDPFMNPTNTKPNWQRGSNPLNNEIIRRNAPAYGRVGVKYVVTDPFENLSGSMRLVYRSEVMKIFELPEYTPYFSGSGCDVRAISRDEVEVRCDRPTTIVRLESFTPNWKANIDGKSVKVSMYNGLFQSVEVPAGASILRFTYGCPHGMWTVPMFWLGALVVAAAGVVELRKRADRASRIEYRPDGESESPSLPS
jgi:hypothetical protein